jgi:hypothetical protein
LKELSTPLGLPKNLSRHLKNHSHGLKVVPNGLKVVPGSRKVRKSLLQAFKKQRVGHSKTNGKTEKIEKSGHCIFIKVVKVIDEIASQAIS